jgi:hypothetical protein
MTRFRPRTTEPKSLGNPNGCYGVVLTITAGGRHATKRAIVKCGGLGDG